MGNSETQKSVTKREMGEENRANNGCCSGVMMRIMRCCSATICKGVRGEVVVARNVSSFAPSQMSMTRE